MRSRIQSTESAVLLMAMFAGAVTLWIGVPFAWLYIGSQVQEATGSVGAAIGVMLPGVVITIMLAVPVLGRINEVYEHLREARGLQNFGQAPLEAVLVISAVFAVVACAIWILFVSGGPPLPVAGGD